MLLAVAVFSYLVIMAVQYEEEIEKTTPKKQPKKRCEYCANYVRYDIFEEKCYFFKLRGECANTCKMYVEMIKCPKCNKPLVVRNWRSRYIGHGYVAKCPTCDYVTEVLWTKKDYKEIIKEVKHD